MLTIDPHPLLDLAVLTTRWSDPMGQTASPEWLLQLARADCERSLPPPTDEQTRAVRDLLRHGGFKPAGRNKPCNEYIRKAVAADRFPVINPAVDVTNVVVSQGGLPVSTVDLDRTHGALRVGIAPAGSQYVFNASGQVIDLSGLLCLFDEEGPCANAVKDSHRTKTQDATTHTVTVIWGTVAWSGRADAVASLATDLIGRLGGQVQRGPATV